MILLLLLLAASEITTRAGAVPIQPGNWVGADDYPAKAMADRTQGNVAFRLAIDVNGRPDDCGILTSSGSQELDVATCETLLTNARFKPAIGEDGKPVRAYYSSAVRWMLPKDAVPWQSSSAVVHIGLNVDGSVTTCTQEPPEASRVGGCTVFHRADMLAQIVPTPLTKLRSIEIRFVQDVSDGPVVHDPIPGGAFRTIIGRWTFSVDPAGNVATCREEEKTLPILLAQNFCDPSGFASSVHYTPSPGAPPRTLRVTLETVTQPR